MGLKVIPSRLTNTQQRKFALRTHKTVEWQHSGANVPKKEAKKLVFPRAHKCEQKARNITIEKLQLP